MKKGYMKFQLPENEDAVSKADLLRLTNTLIDDVKQMLRRCADADVTFVPVDPMANDPAAATSEEEGIAWTLGHIIVQRNWLVAWSIMVAPAVRRHGTPSQRLSSVGRAWKKVAVCDWPASTSGPMLHTCRTLIRHVQEPGNWGQ
jgi:hypothetical protein